MKLYPNPSTQTVWIENSDGSKSWDLTILTVIGGYFFQYENKEGHVVQKILKE